MSCGTGSATHFSCKDRTKIHVGGGHTVHVGELSYRDTATGLFFALKVQGVTYRFLVFFSLFSLFFCNHLYFSVESIHIYHFNIYREKIEQKKKNINQNDQYFFLFIPPVSLSCLTEKKTQTEAEAYAKLSLCIPNIN